MKPIITLALLASGCLAGATAHAQINPIAEPFAGDRTENWDDPDLAGAYGYACPPCVMPELNAFQFNARLRDPASGLLLQGPWLNQCVIIPRSNPRLVGSSATGTLQWEFGPAVRKFGGYFGSASGHNTAFLEFIDEAGNVLGTGEIPTIDCDWRWGGWESTGAPIAFVNIKVDPSAGGQIQMDDLVIAYGDAPVCYPDCDGDSVLTIDDFICFQTLFALGDPFADCDEDGGLTIDDFICFQTLFAIGC